MALIYFDLLVSYRNSTISGVLYICQEKYVALFATVVKTLRYSLVEPFIEASLLMVDA